MSHFPALIQDLSIILGVAAIVTFLFRRINQPVVLGYIVAGIVVGPYTPAIFSVAETESIKVWAELGVVFLMFSLGLEFSFRRLARVGVSAGLTAAIQIAVMMILGIITARFLGWSRMDAVFLGCMISISSTTIIIKALEELGLKSKKFAELVFGILVVEDLVAILMLVGLTNIAKSSEINGIELLMAAGNLAIVVGAWFLAGMFIVPRFVTSVRRHGNDEMLTVVAIGLCLLFVSLAAYFHYSVALGAFIIGSIIAESSEAKRIEHLVAPLKDIFGAVFFVSVGMLLNPTTIVENFSSILILSIVIIFGKLISVTIGAFLTGQSITNAVQVGCSMAQIGELSFIIGSLGLTFGVIGENLYPIIVAASLVTTFTTPYLINKSSFLAAKLELVLPKKVREEIANYAAWMQRRSAVNKSNGLRSDFLLKWILNALVVTIFFTLSAEKLAPFLLFNLEESYADVAVVISWVIAFMLSSPSIFAMLSIFIPNLKVGEIIASRVGTIFLIGLLSLEYFPTIVTLFVTFIGCGSIFLLFRTQVGAYYRYMENQFKSGFQADISEKSHSHLLLAPWDAHLVEVDVPGRSFLVGKSLASLSLREKYGINVVVIVREDENIVAPNANEVIYPGDQILCFATDAEIEYFRSALIPKKAQNIENKEPETFELQRVKVTEGSKLEGADLKNSGIKSEYGCIVVGLEHAGKRIRGPKSDTVLVANDVLWIVGESNNIQRLAKDIVV